MADNEPTEQRAARELIADANRALVQLQRERLVHLIEGCAYAYRHIGRSRLPRAYLTELSIDAELARMLRGSFDEAEFLESGATEEFDQQVESFARQLRLQRKRLLRDFDIFLCHNTEDKAEVRSIEGQLRRQGLLPWCDEREIAPGTAWQTQLQADIESVRSCAVIVGPSGLGPWQRREVDVILQLFVERRLPIIPVILPSCKAVPELPPFLRSFGWVDYRTLDPDPLEQLIWGISGRRAAI